MELILTVVPPGNVKVVPAPLMVLMTVVVIVLQIGQHVTFAGRLEQDRKLGESQRLYLLLYRQPRWL